MASKVTSILLHGDVDRIVPAAAASSYAMRVAAAAVLAGQQLLLQLWWLVSQTTPGSKIWSENRSVCSIIKEEVMNRLRANL